MKIGVVGLGAMGKNHARIYSELGLLRAVQDVNESSLSETSLKYGVVGFSNLKDLLLDDNITAVSIAVPTPMHLSVARECLLAGKDILLEKPITTTLEEAYILEECALNSGRIVSIGYVERFNPAYKALKTLFEDGSFGEVTSINIKRVGGEPRTANNVVADLMTHDLNLLMDLVGQYPIGSKSHKIMHSGIVCSAQVLLEFSKMSAVCEANWISPIKVRQIVVTGTGGYCEADLLNQTVTQYRKVESLNSSNQNSFNTFVTSGSRDIVDCARFKKEPLKEEILEFINAVNTRNTAGLVSISDAINTLKITVELA